MSNVSHMPSATDLAVKATLMPTVLQASLRDGSKLARDATVAFLMDTKKDAPVFSKKIEGLSLAEVLDAGLQETAKPACEVPACIAGPAHPVNKGKGSSAPVLRR